MRKLCAVIVLSLTGLAAAQGAQDSGESLPKLISHADAEYPAIARTAHIMGDAVAKITTDGQSVVQAQAESGPTLLETASLDNAKTWKFAPHTPGTFHVTYRFVLTPGDVLTSRIANSEKK
jgi:outer membrane biosynthesis protein TonB